MPRFTTQSPDLVSLSIQERERAPAPAPNESVRSQRIRIKNRRRRYLEIHPEYFGSAHLELADPLLYDRLVRRFQSDSEANRSDPANGSGLQDYADALEASLLRSEAKLRAVQEPDPESSISYTRAANGEIIAVEQDESERAVDKQDGLQRWKEFVSAKFLNGEDDEFDYTTVDNDEGLDDHEEEDRRRLEGWLDEEEEKYLGEGPPQGETGIQDF